MVAGGLTVQPDYKLLQINISLCRTTGLSLVNALITFVLQLGLTTGFLCDRNTAMRAVRYPAASPLSLDLSTHVVGKLGSFLRVYPKFKRCVVQGVSWTSLLLWTVSTPSGFPLPVSTTIQSVCGKKHGRVHVLGINHPVPASPVM